MKKILIMAGYYLPSVKGGGPIQSIKNLVENLSNEFEFYILTADRDLGDLKKFDGITTDTWIQHSNEKIFYTNMNELSCLKFTEIINSGNFDAIYLNSFFSYKESIQPIILNRLNKLSVKTVIIAPRGQFTEGALGLKKNKKNVYLRLSVFFNLYKNVKWHATNEIEKNEIKRIFKKKSDIIVANNLTPNYRLLKYTKQLKKIIGEISIAYISRIHPTKNLLTILKLLNNINGKILFNIYGPIEDEDYWLKCTQIIKDMPQNVTVIYHGIIQNNEVMNVYKSNHIFILLTLGENFGHAISEALIGGCPIIISDRTPWRNLEREKVGWDIPLSDINLITEKIMYFINMSNDEYNVMSKNAFLYSQSQSNKNNVINNYIKMFKID